MNAYQICNIPHNRQYESVEHVKTNLGYLTFLTSIRIIDRKIGQLDGWNCIKQTIISLNGDKPCAQREITHSSFTYFPALLVWHSTDLVHWEPIARAVEDGDYSIFAPDICKVNGKFYIYYPTSKGENYVVTADKIEGPWSAPVKLDTVLVNISDTLKCGWFDSRCAPYV